MPAESPAVTSLGHAVRVQESDVDVQGPRTGRAEGLRRWGGNAWAGAWVLAIVGFALLHAWHLRADFPNGSPWTMDWAKYTDEGW